MNFLKRKIKSGFYNADLKIKIMKIAKMVKDKTNAKIKVIRSNDPNHTDKTNKNN